MTPTTDPDPHKPPFRAGEAGEAAGRTEPPARQDHETSRVAPDDGEPFHGAQDATTGPAPPAPGSPPPSPAPGNPRRYRVPLLPASIFKIGLMLSLCAAVGLLLAYLHVKTKSDIRKATSRIAKPFLPTLAPRYGILLLGTDKLIDINRTDTMILVVIDPKNHAVDAISVLRDTYTSELTIKVKKLNGVYANELIRSKDEQRALIRTRDVVSRIMGMPIDHYVRVDLDGFVRVVDLIGGVEIYVDKDMKYDDFSQNLHINLKEGYQRLDGEKAQQFVRYRRDADGDRTRAERQQRFLHALLRRLMSPGVLFNLPDVVRGGLAEIETDLPLDTALALANHFLASDRVALATHTLPGEYARRDDLDYFLHDPKKTTALMAGILDPERFAKRTADTAEVALPEARPR